MKLDKDKLKIIGLVIAIAIVAGCIYGIPFLFARIYLGF